jgi:hypothetical protein
MFSNMVTPPPDQSLSLVLAVCPAPQPQLCFAQGCQGSVPRSTPYMIISKPVHAFRQYRPPDPLPVRIYQQQLKLFSTLGLPIQASVTTLRARVIPSLSQRAVIFALGAVEPTTGTPRDTICKPACECFILNKEKDEVSHDVNCGARGPMSVE